MKKFRLVCAALLAVFMSANFTSCSKDDDGANIDIGGNEEGGNGEVVVSEKKLMKMVSNYETYTFTYDDEGRLSTATEDGVYSDNTKYKDSYQFIWGDDAIMVKSKENDDNEWSSYTLTLKNGLVRSSNGYGSATISYNSSNRFVRAEIVSDKMNIDVIWDKDKFVSVERYFQSDSYTEYEASLTYGETCKKGYFPLISEMIDFDCNILFMAHPDIIGMRTNQLPNTYTSGNDEISLTYEYDKDGYISKIKVKDDEEDSDVYTLTWK